MPRPVARRRVHQSSGAVVRCPEQAGRPFRIVADSPRLHAGDPHKSSGNHTRVVEARCLLAPERAPGELLYGETTSYLPSILSRPWRAFRGRDVQAGWSPGARGCWEASSGPLGLHVVHFRSNRADRPTSRPPPRECSLGRSAPTR